MKLFIDARDSERTGEALLSLGDEPGGRVMARVPYVTAQDRQNARFFALAPEAFEELEGMRALWWYLGPMKITCPNCENKGEIPGASDAQVGRLERLRIRLEA